MTTETLVYLVRHAESSPISEVPEAEWPLSAKGRNQVEQLKADLLPLNIDLIFSSPYLRARQTVAPFAEANRLEISICEGLKERKLKDGFVEDFDELIKRAWQDFNFALPGCETGLNCQARMFALLEQLTEQNPGKKLLLSSHGNAIALLLNRLDNRFGFDFWRGMRNPDIIKILSRENQFEVQGSVLDRSYQS